MGQIIRVRGRNARFAATALLAVVAAGCVTVGQPPKTAAPDPVATRCGTLVTQDLVLAGDMTCGGRALLVGADNVTIDLNGHTIHGVGAAANAEAIDSGDDLSEPVHSFAVRNGTISGFGTGISINDSLYAGHRLNVDRVHFLVLASGVSLTGSADDSITNSVFEPGGNGAHTALAGGFKGDGGTDRYAFNTFDNMGTAITGFEWSSVTVEHNTFSHDQTAIYLVEDFKFTIRDNDFGFNGTAVSIQQLNTEHTISGNVIHDNHFGILVENLTTVGMPGQANIAVTGNTLTNNGASGLAVVISDPVLAMVVDGNTASQNGAKPAGATTAPVGNDPLDDGITIRAGAGSAVAVSNNHTDHNADHGIDASGVTDGGGNTGTMNVHAPQCVGVVC